MSEMTKKYAPFCRQGVSFKQYEKCSPFWFKLNFKKFPCVLDKTLKLNYAIPKYLHILKKCKINAIHLHQSETNKRIYQRLGLSRDNNCLKVI